MRIAQFETKRSQTERPSVVMRASCNETDVREIERAYLTQKEVCLEDRYFNDTRRYAENDVLSLLAFSHSAIKRVIFHDPATIVFWIDGSKTVVKTMPGDIYNPEVGLAMCISKKALGDKFHHEFKKWIKED